MQEGSFVFDKVTGSMGRVKKLHGPGEYISPVNRLPVQDAVLELEGGASFVAEEGRFAQISEAAVNECASIASEMLNGLGAMTNDAIKKCCRGAADPRLIARVISTVLGNFAKDLAKQMEPKE